MKEYISKETLNQIQPGTLLWYGPFGFGLVLSRYNRIDGTGAFANIYWQDGFVHLGKEILEHDLESIENEILEIVA